MNSIITTKKVLSEYNIPLKGYVVWDKRNKNWFFPRSRHHCTFIHGLWATKEDAEADLPNTTEYYISEVDFGDKVPADMLRIANYRDDEWSRDEKARAIKTKFTNMVKIFIFSNRELVDYWKQWKEQ